jgi:hypothetical protein
MVQENESGGRREYFWFAAALLLILVGSLKHAPSPQQSINTQFPTSNLSER